MDKIKNLKLLKEITVKQLRSLMDKTVDEVLIVDIGMFPENMTRESITQHLKNTGVSFVTNEPESPKAEYFFTAVKELVAAIDFINEELEACGEV